MNSAEIQRILKVLRAQHKYIQDDLMFTEDDRPIHICESYTDPEKGFCSFCDMYWEAEAILKEYKV